MHQISQNRAVASMLNIRMRRWIGWQIDVIGICGFSIVSLGALISHMGGHLAAGEALGVSLTYSVISIYGRTSRTLVRLRQTLDNSGRLLGINDSQINPRPNDEEYRSDPLIELIDVGYAFGSQYTKVISGLQVRLHKRDVLSVTGESGVGKSSFARLLLGELEPTEGSIKILGIRPSVFDAGSLAFILGQWLDGKAGIDPRRKCPWEARNRGFSGQIARAPVYGLLSILF